MLSEQLLNFGPGRALAFAKRFLQATVDHHGKVRDTYAQHGEDLIIEEMLLGFDLSGGIYCDVGANQPSRISNTYKFYRRGFHGVALEPNPELRRLFRRFRPRDVLVSAAAGATPGVGKIMLRSSVASSMSAAPGDFHYDVLWVPVLDLDSIMESLAPAWIFLLTVDVEGMDVAVLQGAIGTLEKCFIVCVEANDSEQDAAIRAVLEPQGFELVRRVPPNLIFQNRRDFSQFRR